MAKDIKVDSVKYQRNGCSGTGFFAVAFRFRQGREWTPMVATVRPGKRYPAADVCVVDPAAPRAIWDGPYFAPALALACKEAEQDGSAYRE